MILANLQKHWYCVVAFKDGKTIQWKNPQTGVWVDRVFPKFKLDELYRVKNIHQAVIDAHAEGAEVEFKCNGDTIWTQSANPLWNEDIKYRVVLFAAEKTAFKDGKEIQFKNTDTPDWEDIRNPSWVANCEYRVKNKWQEEMDAQEAGKIIEAKQPYDTEWHTNSGGWKFNSNTLEYRIKTIPKPEPKVIYVNEYSSGGLYAYHEENIAKGGINSTAKRLAVRYVEAQD